MYIFSIITNLLEIFCTKFGYNWSSGSGEVVNIFLQYYASLFSLRKV